jgi:GT2 family glycosyltransferase
MSSSPETTNPLVSIVVVTWNAKRYVEECLASLRANAPCGTEVIVVDNGSSDGTPDLIRETFPEVRLIVNAANHGFARGNNIGIAASRGRYLFLVNSDVNVPAGCLQKIIKYMDSHPEVGLLGPQMLGPHHEIRRSTMRSPTLANLFGRALALDTIFRGTRWAGGFLMGDFAHDATREVEVLNGWFWVARRQAVEQVGGLDEQFFMYGEDLDWCYRFRAAGWKLVFFAGAAAVHYGGMSSAAAPVRFYVEMQRANLQYWKKHHGRLSCVGYRLIAVLHELLRMAGYAVVRLFRAPAPSEAAHKFRRSLGSLNWILRIDGGR